MDLFTAIEIAEGQVEVESDEQFIEAWQYLHDNRMQHWLQGWFGRTARDMVEAGTIVSKN